jgi:signal transduction histidine kinase
VVFVVVFGCFVVLGGVVGFLVCSVNNIILDRHGNIWFTSERNGTIGVIDSLCKTVRYLKNETIRSGSYHKPLLEDKGGNIWLGNDKGIFVINAKRDSITSLTVDEGLIDNNIMSLNQYQNQIYANTQKGLTIITPAFFTEDKKWGFESIGSGNGINRVTGNWKSDIITKNGRFLMGDRGITSFKNGNKPNPEVCITGIDIFNQPHYFSNKPWSFLDEKDTLWGTRKNTFYIAGALPAGILFPGKSNIEFDSVKGYYNMPANLSLPHYQNYLQFHFTQLKGDGADTTWYSYILEGVNKKWSDRTYKPMSENYLNLQPGNYTFKVTSLSDGKWTKPAEFSFEIRPPWWQTWWAYSLYMLVLSVIIILIVQYRSRKLKAENLALEEKINQRTSELKQSLQDLKATQTQLIQSEKMASLGELTAGIAHEIQNPLNFVNNFSEVNDELLKELSIEAEKGNLDEVKAIAKDIQFNSEKINHHGKRADSIVKGMLQHSRSSSGQKEPTDINALADEYLRLAYHGLRAKDKSFNATMKTDFDENIGKINVVPQEIGRIILNLINNAFYAVDEKKKSGIENYEPMVTISTKTVKPPSRGLGVEIKVSDNGNGVPQKVLDKIFQPFFTTKPTGQGTGLGLSLSYDIVKAHGGELNVKTKEGEGSEFIISLPLT